ncbi:sulfite exporter TauE/SafE family protein [Bacillaceae bacterium]
MYEFFSRISAWLSQPFADLIYSTDVALIAALLLGFVGSVAPCQISANIGAITYFSHRHAQQKMNGLEILFYLLGKMLVYSVLGLIVWIFGKNISNESIPVFVFARKMVGPLLILIGLFLLGWVKLPGDVGFRFAHALRQFSERVGGKSGAFLMGVAFSLGFCPTMFWLFFGMLMPMVLESSSGVLLPPVFAIGTAMPLLFFFAVCMAFGLDKVMVKKARRWGGWIQKGAGILFVLLGISDTLTYWTL